MSILTTEELKKLKESGDKELAAMALKLEQDIYIPKDRFDEVNEERKKVVLELQKILDDRKKVEENKAIEDGKLKEVLLQKEAEINTLKPKAEGYDSLKSKIDEEDKVRRDKLFIRITDEKIKKIAQELSTLSLEEFVTDLTEKNRAAILIPGQTKVDGTMSGLEKIEAGLTKK